MYNQIELPTNRHKNIETYKSTNTQTYKNIFHMDKNKNRPTHRKTNRSIEMEKYINQLTLRHTKK